MYVNCAETTNNDLICMVGTQFNRTDILQIELLVVDNTAMPITEIENLINTINNEMDKTIGN